MAGIEIHKMNGRTAEVLPAKGKPVSGTARTVLAVGASARAVVDTVTSRGRVAFRVRKDPVDGVLDALHEALFGGGGVNTHPGGSEDAGGDAGPVGGGDDDDGTAGDGGTGGDEGDDTPADDGDDALADDDTDGTPSLEEILAADDDIPVPSRNGRTDDWQKFLTARNIPWDEDDTRADLIARWEETEPDEMNE